MEVLTVTINDITRPLPENINLPVDFEGNTYMHNLCSKRVPVEMIVDAVKNLGASLETLNKKKLPPLATAIVDGQQALVETLIDLGSPLYQDIGGGLFFNAALLAVMTGNPVILKTVLERGGGHFVNLEGVDSSGKKADGLCLHFAVTGQKPELIKTLVAVGAFIDREGGDRAVTPLQLAALMNFVTPMKALVDSGAALNQANSANGFTALHYASLNDKGLAAEKLIDLGANPNAKSKDGITPLLLAVANKNIFMAEVLLKNGADPDIKSSLDDQGTPLMLASKKGHGAIVDLLLKANADPLLTDAFNKTAAQVAREAGYSLITVQLENLEKILIERKFEKSYSSYRP